MDEDCHQSNARIKRKFVAVEYVDGVPSALPSRCPWHEDGQQCDVRRHGARDRAFGPEHALTVVGCLTHGQFFTLYPHGWTPYGRAPVVVVTDQDRWRATLFAAAVITAAAQFFRALDGYRRTLARQIARSARWLGMIGPAGERIAAELGMDLHAHVERRRAYAGARTWKRRAQLVVDALAACERTSALWQRMLAAGKHAGLCGRPLLVDRKSGALASLVR